MPDYVVTTECAAMTRETWHVHFPVGAPLPTDDGAWLDLLDIPDPREDRRDEITVMFVGETVFAERDRDLVQPAPEEIR
jgi:hypothetical protein